MDDAKRISISKEAYEAYSTMARTQGLTINEMMLRVYKYGLRMVYHEEHGLLTKEYAKRHHNYYEGGQTYERED